MLFPPAVKGSLAGQNICSQVLQVGHADSAFTGRPAMIAEGVLGRR